jgi:hypothetical protein
MRRKEGRKKQWLFESISWTFFWRDRKTRKLSDITGNPAEIRNDISIIKM